MKRYLIALTVAACLTATACSDWERTTFQTLSASQAVINGASADYEARTIPHTACVKDLIEKARAVDSDAVRALGVYEVVKNSKTPTEVAQLSVDQALANLAPVVASIQTLSTNPCGGAQ